MYLIHQESGKQINLGEEPLIIAREWLTIMGKRVKGVQEVHARMLREGERCYIVGLAGDTYCNGRKLSVGEPEEVKHNTIIHLGDKKKGTILVFKDLDQSQRMLDTQKLQAAKLDMKHLKSAAETMSRELFSAAPTDLAKFSEYFLNFLFDKFRIHRGVMYEVRDKRWIPVRARALSSKFVPPKKILSQVWEDKVPVHFDLPEARETGELTPSIVGGNVQSAICFPMLRKESLIGVVYIDTQKREVMLSRDDLVVLCAIMPSVSAYFYLLTSHDRRKVEAKKTLSSFCKPDNLGSRGMKCEYVNKDLNSFSFSRAGKDDSSFFFYVQIVNRNNEETDFTLQVAAYCGVFSLLDTFQVYAGKLDEIVSLLQGYLTGRFPTLRVSVGIVRVVGTTLVYTGFGTTYLAIKPPERNGFFAHGGEPNYSDGRGSSHPTYAIDYELVKGSYFVLSSTSGERLCDTFDRVKNLDRVWEDLRTLPGCVFCQIGERNEEAGID